KRFLLRRLGRLFRLIRLHESGILWNKRRRGEINKRQLSRLFLNRKCWRESPSQRNQGVGNYQVNEKRRQQRPQNFSSLLLAIDRSVARLGEHDLGRRHESGL